MVTSKTGKCRQVTKTCDDGDRIKTSDSDARSQYRCGRVGRGIQPPATPQPTANTRTYAKSIKNARFPTFQLDDHGPTDQRTDLQTDG